MANGQADIVLQHIRKLIGVPAVEEMTDGQLLEQFTAQHEEAAFAELVRRHGSLVLSVCRGVLNHPHDAEDAFQATFLVLARKAGSIRKHESLGSWLYGVAYRVARKAKVQTAQRRAHEREAVSMAPSDPLAEVDLRELRPLLFAELNRLPTTYRAAVVLCYLEGKTNEEAARQLRWPLGTVKGRLTRARDLLRDRLTRRGVTLSAGLVATVLAEQTASAGVPATLVHSTVKAATLFAAGKASAAGVSAPVATLVEGVLHEMFQTKLKIAVAWLLAVALIGAGAGVLTYHALAADQPPVQKADAAPQPPPARVAAEPKPEPARERKFDSTHFLTVYQLTGRSQPKLLGTTPTAKHRGIVIPAGATWYVAPPGMGMGGGLLGGFGGGIGFGGGAGLGGGAGAVGFGGGAVGFGGGAFGAGGAGFGGMPAQFGGGAGFGGGAFGAAGAKGDGGGGAGFGGGALGGGGAGFAGGAVGIGGGAGFAGGGQGLGQPPNGNFAGFGMKLTQKELKALIAEIKKQSIPGLGIEYHPEFTDAELAQLKDLTALQTLVLRDTGVTDAGLKHVQNMKALQTLIIESKEITGKGLADLKNLTRLRTLQLSGPRIDDDCVAPLGELSGLKTLRLRWTKIDDDGLKELTSLDALKSVNGLEELEIVGGAVTDKGLAHLNDLAGLKRLRLYLTKITDDGLECLKDLPELKVLIIDCCSDGIGFVFHADGKFVGMGGAGFGGGGAVGGAGLGGAVGGAGFGGAAGKTNLFTPIGPLEVPTGKVTNAGLKHLKGMKQLTQLGVTSWHVTDAGLENLKDLGRLKWLQLGSPDITDKGLVQLKGLTELETLDLMATQTTGGGAAHLKNLPKLKVLYVAVFCNAKDVTEYRRTLFRTKIQKCDFLAPFGQPGAGMIGGADFARPN
jgi:RNA polymerase sigma factor (sigma-70 family)